MGFRLPLLGLLRSDEPEEDAAAETRRTAAREACMASRDDGMTDRPCVRVEPGWRFGQPHIGGVSTDAIAGLIAAGEDEATVCREYDLSRRELLLALWFEGIHGSCRHRAQLGAWAQAAYKPLADGRIDDVEVPDMTWTQFADESAEWAATTFDAQAEAWQAD